ncbi:acyclic terpene utilization AtuA family protein [Caulobacter sp. KR2-114]|uniref:acyclic terpene utilization AtuA family protein n=1 Tax=Caulobacter sp. KR2-114 TaxID=3400912 RepID=UPI003C064188
MDGATPDGRVAVLVPTGALGAGVRMEHVERGLALGAVAIAADAGSTDSGPSYLARGVSKWPREAVKRDLEVLMTAAAKAGVPLLVGSCGTSGSDDALDWTADIAREVARERGLTPKIALLYCEQPPALIRVRNATGRVRPLPPSDPATDELIDACDHIVALMGPEPYAAALDAGADIVLGGRTTDTAILAAVPLMRGAGAGPAWHAAKVAECGGVCTEKRGEGGVLIRVGVDDFEIEPLSATNQCTPHSVSAHMLYENSDPNRLIEPGGILDVSDAVYTALDDRRVRVTGSVWKPQPYTMKLEGAGAGPYQTISLVGIEDPKVLADLDLFHDRLVGALRERIERTFGEEAGEFDVSARLYGWNAVSGRKMPKDAAIPHEVGVLLVITAATQSLATRMSKTCNPIFFHFPLSPELPQPSYGFAFTPAEIERGRVYRFLLNHVVETADGLELVRIRWAEAGQPHARETLDA